jgi:hypothetical protein
MAPATTSTEGCGVRIKWQTPRQTGGRAIQNYKVEVRGSAGNFYSLDSYCGGDTSTTCAVPMSSLTNYPYNLKKDDLIIVRVAAFNDKGYGEASAINSNGSRMLDVPSVVPVVSFVSRTARTIKIQWSDVLNSN